MPIKHRGTGKVVGIPVGADMSPAYAQVDKFIDDVSASSASIKVDADVSAAEGRIKRFMQTTGKAMLLDVHANTKDIEKDIDKISKKSIKIEIESPRVQTMIQDVLRDTRKLALGTSAALKQGQEGLAQGYRQTLKELLDQFGDLSTEINGKLVSGIENIVSATEDIDALGPIVFKTKGLEQAQELTAKTAENVEQITKGLSNQAKEADKAVATQKKLAKAYLDAKKVYEVKTGTGTFAFPTQEKAEQHADNIRALGSAAEVAVKKLGELDEKLRDVYEGQYYKPTAGYKPGKTFQLKGVDLDTYLSLIAGHSDFKTQYKNLLKQKQEGRSSALITPSAKMLENLGFMLDQRTDISSEATDLLERILARRLESQDKLQALLEQGRTDATSAWADMAGNYDGLKNATEQTKELTAAQRKMVETAELLSTLHSKFDTKFNDIFGETMKSFGDALNIDNATAMYDALIAKEQEYYDTIKNRAEATASLTTLANEKFQDYAGIEEFRNKLTSLISDIMEGHATFEQASSALKEFANTLSIANPDISSYQDLYKALEKLVSLTKQLKPEMTDEFSKMYSALDGVGYHDSKESLIDDIKAQYDNVKRIKASIKNGLDVYKDIDGSGYEATYGIDKDTLKNAENMLRGYIYQAIEYYGYTVADVMNDFSQKRVRAFVEGEINKYLEVSKQNDEFMADAKAFNEPIEKVIESITSAIYNMATDSKTKDSVSGYLAELQKRSGDVNRFTLSSQANHIGSLVGINTPYDEIKANAKKIESYKELCEVISRYNELQKDSVIYGGNDYPGLDETGEMERQRLREMLNATGGKDIWKLSGFSGFDDVDKVAKALGIEVPKAIEKAESAQANAVKTMSQLIDNYNSKLDESNNKLMQGTNLLNEQGQILRLFHSSNDVFDQFDDSKIAEENMMGRGQYLSTSQTDFIKGYGKYQTQWYANIKKMFDYDNALSPDDAAKIVSTYCTDAVETFMQKMLADLTTNREAFSALVTISEAYEKDIADILSTVGYDAIKIGSAINVFDKKNLHRANDVVLNTDTEEFRKLNSIWDDLQAAKILAERHPGGQSDANINRLQKEYDIQKGITDEILRRSLGLKESIEVSEEESRGVTTPSTPSPEDIQKSKIRDAYNQLNASLNDAGAAKSNMRHIQGFVDGAEDIGSLALAYWRLARRLNQYAIDPSAAKDALNQIKSVLDERGIIFEEPQIGADWEKFEDESTERLGFYSVGNVIGDQIFGKSIVKDVMRPTIIDTMKTGAESVLQRMAVEIADSLGEEKNLELKNFDKYYKSKLSADSAFRFDEVGGAPAVSQSHIGILQKAYEIQDKLRDGLISYADACAELDTKIPEEYKRLGLELPATFTVNPDSVKIEGNQPVEVPVTPVMQQKDISTMVPSDIINKITQGINIEKMLTDRGLQGEKLDQGIDLFKDFAGSLYLGDSSPISSTDLFNDLFDFVTKNAQATQEVQKTLGDFRDYMKSRQIRIPENMENSIAAEFVDTWKDLKKLYAIGGSKDKKKLLTTSKYASTPDVLVEELLNKGFGYVFDSRMMKDFNGSAQDSLHMLLDAIQRAKDEFKLPKTQTTLGLSDEEQLDFSTQLIEAVNKIEQNVTALHAPIVSASANNDALAESAERTTSALEGQAESAERAAEAMIELQDAESDISKKSTDSKKLAAAEKVVDLLEKDTLATLDIISAAERRTRTGYDFNVSTTGELEDRFSTFAETLSDDTGMKIGKIKVGTKLATLELYNDELKKAIRYTYQLTEAEEDGRRELKLVNEEYAQNIKALQENKFDAVGYQAIAQRAVEELRASLKGLKTPSSINFEQLDGLAGGIKGKDDWTAFDNQIKAAKKSVDTLKQSISTSNSMNTLVSAVRGMANSEATIRDYQVQLNELGNIPGVDKAQEKIDAMTEAARKYKEEAKTGEDQVKFFNEFNDNEVAFKSLLSGLSDLSKMTADMKTAEIDIRRMQYTLDGFKDVYGVEYAAAQLKIMTEALDEFNDTSDITKKASARQKYTSAESEFKSLVAELRESQKGRTSYEDIRIIQDRLYKEKKNSVTLEMGGTASESELQAAQRLTEELEQQYQTSLYLAKTTDDYYAAKQRELQLEKELQSVQQEQYNKELDRIARAEEVSDAEKSKQEIAQYESEQDALAKARLELQKEKFQAQREEKAGRDALLKVQREQDKLYEQKKKFAKLEYDESTADSDLQTAKRKTEELERQYDASIRLLRTEEDYNAIKQREMQLEDELRTVHEEQYEAQSKRLEAAEEKSVADSTKQEIAQYNKEQDALEAAKAERDKAMAKLQTFSRWKSDIKNIGMLSDETAQRIDNIGNAIAHIGDNTDVKQLAEDFEALQSDVKYETTQSKATKTRIADIKESLEAEAKELKALFGQLDLELDLGDKAPNAKQIKQDYDAITESIKRCASASGEYNQEEIAALMRRSAAVKEEMQARMDAESIWWGGSGGGNPPDGGNPPLDDNKIKQWYQSLNSTIQQISKIETKMHGLMLKDDGTGDWAPLIESLESQRSVLLDKVRDIGKEINAAFGGQFVQGDQIDLPFSNILSSIKDFDAPTAIADFFSDIRTQTVLSEQSIEKFVANLQAAQNKTEEFSTGIKEGIYSTLQSSETTLHGLFKNGLVDPENDKYKLAVKELLAYQEAVKSLTDPSTGKLTDPASWTSQQIIGILEMTNALNKYTSEVKTGALAEAKYFEAKKQYANVSSAQSYDDITASMEKTSNSTNDARTKLEKYVSAFKGGQKVITGFTTSADGISKIDFSVLEEGTGHLRHFSAEMGQFTNNIYTVEASLKNMTAGTDAVKSALASMQQIMDRLNARGFTADNNDYVADLQKRMQALKEAYVSGQGDQGQLQNSAMDAERLLATLKQLENAYLNISDAVAKKEAFPLGQFDKNADSAEQFANALKQLSIATNGTVVDVGKFNGEIKQIPVTISTSSGELKKFIIDVEKLGSTMVASLQSTEKAKTGWQEFFGDGVGGILKEVGRYAASLVGVYDFVRYLKEGFNEVLEIDTAMTELKKVTNETDIAYDNFLSTMSKSAGAVGSTVKDITASAADWARLGYSMEEAGKLAENTMILMNVSEFDNVANATDALISSLQAFKDADVSASDFSMQIIDKFNQIGNSYAISTSDLANSLTRSSAALVAANNSLEESIALTTAANTTIQDPEAVGNALKVVSMRIRGKFMPIYSENYSLCYAI